MNGDIMIGCLCIHGFTGAPYEIEPLAEHLRKTRNWIIKTPTLPGHGDTLLLKGIAYHKWLDHAEEELINLLSICDEVYLIGFSMGGLIASYLAAHYPVKKLVLLSAAVYYVNPKQLFLDLTNMVKDSVKGKLSENELFQRYKKKIMETPVTATMEFRKLVRHTRPFLKNIHIPTLIIQGECDGIVPVKSAHYLYKVIPAENKQLVFLSSSQHHVCHGADQTQLFSVVEQFLLS
jgi:carboxylesterase